MPDPSYKYSLKDIILLALLNFPVNFRENVQHVTRYIYKIEHMCICIRILNTCTVLPA